MMEKAVATRSSVLAEIVLGQRSPVGYSPWGRKKLDMTELLSSQPENQVHVLCLPAGRFVLASFRKVNLDAIQEVGRRPC